MIAFFIGSLLGGWIAESLGAGTFSIWGVLAEAVGAALAIYATYVLYNR